MSISAAAFNAANTIQFKAPILVQDVNPREGEAVRDFCFIDVNNNHKVDREYQRTGFSTYRLTYTEPHLSVDPRTIAAQLKNQNQPEIVTQDELDAKISDVTVDTGTTVFTKTQVRDANARPLEALIPTVAPLGKANKWAINTQTGEFIVYSPKQP